VVLGACSSSASPSVSTTAPSASSVATAASSPSTAPASQAPTGTITFSGPVDTPGFYPALGKEYSVNHPGATVNVIEGSWGTFTDKVKTDFAAGGYTYDVVFLPVNVLPQFAEAGWITPFTSDQVAQISPDNLSMQIGTYNGKVYGAPYTPFPQLMVANKKLLDEAGVQPPKTWDDFVNACLALQKIGHKYCIDLALSGGAGGYTAKQFQVMAYAFGGKLVDSSGKVTFNTDPQTIASAQWIADGLLKQKFIDPASLTTDDFAADTSFAQGKYAFHISSSWGYFQADHNPQMSTIMGSAEVIPMPTRADGQGGGTVSWGAALVIPSTAKNPALAWDFVKWMVSDGPQSELVLTTGDLPVLKHLYTDPAITDHISGMPVIADTIAKGTSTLPYTWEPQFEAAITPAMQNAWSGKVSVQDALNQAAQALKQ
jgi:multiple sugar transport system substrate-binding protein